MVVCDLHQIKLQMVVCVSSSEMVASLYIDPAGPSEYLYV